MTRPEDPSKTTFTPTKERISLSYASLGLLAGMAAGLGGAFMTFYASVCTPQVMQAQSEKRELMEVLSRLTAEVKTNTKATEELNKSTEK
jgi:hypothetical protein